MGASISDSASTTFAKANTTNDTAPTSSVAVIMMSAKRKRTDVKCPRFLLQNIDGLPAGDNEGIDQLIDVCCART